jgi:membrane protease YdiL (CAAX protease family)
MSNRMNWVKALAMGAAIAAVLLGAMFFRDLAKAIGIEIPRLPMSSYAGSSTDNLLAVFVVLTALLALKPKGNPSSIVRLLGLGAPGWRAPMLVLLSTVPIWLSSVTIGTIQQDIDVRGLLFTALLFPFAEELVFRGFGFVFPRIGLGWRLLPACSLQALCFGAYHWLGLRGSEEAVTVLCITFLGGIVFAVLDALNRYTIWSGLAFHCSLNAAWGMFDVSSSGSGWGWVTNLLRVLCAALAVFLVWFIQRKTSIEPREEVLVKLT